MKENKAKKMKNNNNKKIWNNLDGGTADDDGSYSNDSTQRKRLQKI